MNIEALSSVAEIAMGSAPPSTSYNEARKGVPMIAGAGDFGEFYPSPKQWTTEPTRIAAKGDLIVCVRATIGDLNWADREYCLGRGVAGIRANPNKADIRYIARVLEAKKAELSRLGTGSTFLAIRKADLEGFEIPLLPLDEQKRIAVVLDKADALRRQRQKSLQLTEKLLQSAFLDIFGDPETNPKGWEQCSLESLCERIVDCPHSTPVYSDAPTGFYCVRSSEIQNGRLDLTSARHVSESVFTERIARHEPRAGEVIYTREGGRLGNAGQVPKGKRICLGQRMMLFSGKTNVATNSFLNGLLNSGSFRNTVFKLVGGGAAPRVNIKDLRALIVYRPPIDVQLRYDHFATVLAEEEESLVESQMQVATLFSVLQQRAFLGELDLSRLVLHAPEDSPPAYEVEKPASKGNKPESAAPFLQVPEAVAAALKELDDTVSAGEPIPWSADYFKYRILGANPTPFSFGEVMQRAESIFDDPPYDELKDLILQLLGNGGGPALLIQSFDLHIDANTKEASGRKEIVFGPAA